MDESQFKIWEILFQRALEIIDSVKVIKIDSRDWSFGGGTVLMRRHHHRFSKDIDIFFSDPQYFGYLNPRLNDAIESLTGVYREQANSLKLIFKEGEIDFIASAPLTQKPTKLEIVLGREIQVETSTEIVAKKLWHRGEEFTARDIFDLAMVTEKEPDAINEIKPIVRGRSEVIKQRIATHETALRESFEALDVLDYRRSFDECLKLLNECFKKCN